MPKNIYVDAVNGNNSNNGLTEATARQTLQSAHSLTDPGDVVLIKNGTYTNADSGQVLLITRSGTPGNPITYRNFPGHSPKIEFNSWHGIQIPQNVSYITIDGLEIEGNVTNVTWEFAQTQLGIANPITNGSGITIDSRGTNDRSRIAHHITVQNCKVYNCCGGGIAVIRGDWLTFDNNEVYNNAWFSIYANSGISIYQPVDIDFVNTATYKLRITNNRCYNNRQFIGWVAQNNAITDGNGIIYDDSNNTQIGSTFGIYSSRCLIANNISYLNGGSGIHTYDSRGCDIVGNSAFWNSQSPNLGVVSGGQIYASSNSQDVKIVNNILYADGKWMNNNGDTSNGVTYTNNIFFGTTPDKIRPTGPSNRTIDPQFVSIDIGDYIKFHTEPNRDLDALGVNVDLRLQSTSPAIDSGVVFTTMLPADLDGNPRVINNVPDIGAYEFNGPFDPIAPPESLSDRVGFALSFARQYAANNLDTGKKVLLIPVAAEDSSFSGNNWNDNDPEFEKAVSQTLAALNLTGSQLKAILWHGTESDLGNLNKAQYIAAFDNFVSAFKTAIAQPDVPVITGEFSRIWNVDADTEALNDAVLELPSRISNTEVANSSGLVSNPGEPENFNAESAKLLGLRYYNKYMQTVNESVKILDTYPQTFAFSLHKRRTAYNGACLRVQRLSDNAESDIGFTVNGYLDLNQLFLFTKASDFNVVTFYDQSVNAANAVADVGAVKLVFDQVGRIALKFNNSNMLITNNGDKTNNVPAITMMAKYQPLSFDSSGLRVIFASSQTSGTSTRSYIGTSNFNPAVGGRRLEANTLQSASFLGLSMSSDFVYVQSGVLDYVNAQSRVYLDGELLTQQNFQTPGNSDTTDSNRYSIGRNVSPFHYFDGLVYDIYMKNSLPATGEREAIETALMIPGV